MTRAADYAAALGASLGAIEQLADSGLLSDSGGARQFSRAKQSMQAQAEWSGGGPTLDPVPQELYATVEARYVAVLPG